MATVVGYGQEVSPAAQFIINCSDNLADRFTKSLAAKQFQHMRLFFVKDIKLCN